MNRERDMIDVKEKLMNNFEQVKQAAISHMIKSNFIKTASEVNIKNVIRYNKDVELTKKDSNGKEKSGFKLYVVEWENTNSEVEGENSLTELEFLVEEDENGNIVNINTIEDLIQDYEPDSFKNIKDVVDKTKENEEKPEEEQDLEFKKESLEELEGEKEKEKEGNTEDEKGKDPKDSLNGKKPTYMLQTIDVNNTYVDNWTTVSRAFDLPAEVKYIAIASPMEGDKNAISSNMTMYMLDANGNIIEDVRGGNISDYFEIDDATGHNPMYDNNTKLELDGDYAEKNIGQTMKRFKSKGNPELYLSIEQKKVGAYHEVYAGGRTLDGNNPIEVQLETRNVEIQTDLEKQEIISTYAGQYNRDEMDQEAHMHEEHGDDEEKLPIAHADGDKRTALKCNYIPGTDKTWEELSEETGEGIKKLQERFVRELQRNKEPKEILAEIEMDYQITGHEHKHN